MEWIVEDLIAVCTQMVKVWHRWKGKYAAYVCTSAFITGSDHTKCGHIGPIDLRDIVHI